MTVAAGSSLRRFRDNEIVQSFLRGVTPAVVGLLVAAAISIGRAGIHTVIGLVLAIAAGVVLSAERFLGHHWRGHSTVCVGNDSLVTETRFAPGKLNQRE